MLSRGRPFVAVLGGLQRFWGHLFFAWLAVYLGSGGTLSAANKTWTGGSGFTNNWTSNFNWGGTTAVAGDNLFFGGTTRLSNTNDNTAGTNFIGLTFNAGAGAFTLGGNSITLGGNVTNNSSNLQTINLALILSASRTFTTSSTGSLTIGGIVSETGAARGLIKAGAGTLTLSGANTYTGGTTVNAGTLQISASERLANTGSLTVSGGTFALQTFNETVGTVSLTSESITGSGSATLTGSSYDMQTGSVTAILAGAGVTLTKSTVGTVTLSGANTYSGGTAINAGTLSLGGSGALLASNVIFNYRGAAAATIGASGGAQFNGILLAANNTVQLTGASVVNGEVIGKSVLLSGASKVGPMKPPIVSP